MAYTYLTLVNDVCRRLNEVELTAANFATAVGQYGNIKDSVNYAIRDVNQDAYEWPFNHVTQDVTLAAGTTRYAFETDHKTTSMDTFRIQRNATFNNDTKHLRFITYEEYLATYLDQEYNTSDTGIRRIPQQVFRTPDLEFGVVPPPDEAYTLTYEYYQLPTDLDADTDVPSIPVQFRKTINNGTMYYMYMFRSDTENTQLAQMKFEKDVKQMRKIGRAHV